MTEPASAPAVDVVVTEVIRLPVDVVAAYASDPTNAPEWYAKISEVEWKTPPPLQAGSEVAFAARFLGRELRYTYAIVEHNPESLVMRTTQGPFPMETSYRFHPNRDAPRRPQGPRRSQAPPRTRPPGPAFGSRVLAAEALRAALELLGATA